MELTSKFDMNQMVWTTSHERKSEVITCPACEGKGQVTLSDKTPRSCPECYGRTTKTIWHDLAWLVGHPLTIGQVRAQITNIQPDDIFDNVGHYAKGADVYENSYMCYETGVGSGSLYNENRLFASTKDAQADCDKRNEEQEKS